LTEHSGREKSKAVNCDMMADKAGQGLLCTRKNDKCLNCNVDHWKSSRIGVKLFVNCSYWL